MVEHVGDNDIRNTIAYKYIESKLKENRVYYLRNLNETFAFGKKHKYSTLRYIMLYDPGYIEWALRENAISLSPILQAIFDKIKELSFGKRSQVLDYATAKFLKTDEENRNRYIIGRIQLEKQIRENEKRIAEEKAKFDTMVAEWREGRSWCSWLYDITVNDEVAWETVYIEERHNGTIKGIYKEHHIRVEKTGSYHPIEECRKMNIIKGISIFVDDTCCISIEGEEWMPVWNKLINEVSPYSERAKKAEEKRIHSLPFAGRLEMVDILVK